MKKKGLKVIFLDFNGTIDEPFNKRPGYLEGDGLTPSTKPEDGAFGAKEDTEMSLAEMFQRQDQEELEERRAIMGEEHAEDSSVMFDDEEKEMSSEENSGYLPVTVVGSHLYYDTDGYDQYGFNKNGFTRAGCDKDGFDVWGFDREGYDKDGVDMDGVLKYGHDGFDKYGFDKEGFNRYGYNRDGLDRKGYNTQGYNYKPYLPGVVSQKSVSNSRYKPSKHVYMYSHLTDSPSADSVRYLKALADETGAKIVFSTTRRHCGVKSCIDYIGLPEGYVLNDPLFSITPLTVKREKISPIQWFRNKLKFKKSDNSNSFYRSRQREIKEWLKEWRGEPVENYVILDDDTIDDPEMSKHWVSSVAKNRFLKDEYEHALKILTNKA